VGVWSPSCWTATWIVYLEEYLDYPTGDLYLEGEAQVRQHASAFERIWASALSPDRSTAFLIALAHEI
jgi:uncharacterized protein DUF5753